VHPTTPDLTSTAAPPFMKFDNVDFIQGLGRGEWAGYHPPSNEAGMTVDSKGFVWIPENADGTRAIPTRSSE
jgi:hypothetical protein